MVGNSVVEQFAVDRKGAVLCCVLFLHRIAFENDGVGIANNAIADI